MSNSKEALTTAFRRMGKRFEFRVMCCDESRASAFKQVIEDGARQCRAFLRIGARAKFIEDDQRTLIDLFENADDVRDVTAERAERLLDGLLIANIGIHIVEERQFRTAFSRDVQSALRHERQQTDGFQRNRFSARVRTGNNNGSRARCWDQYQWARRCCGSRRGWRAEVSGLAVGYFSLLLLLIVFG